MIDLDIRRAGAFSEGEVSRKSYENIHAFEAAAAEYFFARLEEADSSGIAGFRIVGRPEVPHSLIDKFGVDAQRFLFKQSQSDFEDKTITTVFDIETKQGAQHQVYQSPERADEIYDLDENWMQGLGTLWVRELFQPGSAPEFVDVAEGARVDFFDPASLESVSLGSETGTEGAVPTARLSAFGLEHFNELLRLYSEIAYPDDPSRDTVGSLMSHYYEQVRLGESIGLRSGTQFLDCTKHELRPSIREDIFQTYMYLNYEIGVAGVRLYFRQDLEMANDFRRAASGLFLKQGIAVLPEAIK